MRAGGSAVAGEFDERDGLALLAAADRRRERARHDRARGFFNERIPFPARVALAGPFGPDRAAGLAGENVVGLGHSDLCESFAIEPSAPRLLTHASWRSATCIR